MRNIIVPLVPAEFYVGGVIGIGRRVASLQNGNDKNRHAQKSDCNTDCDGACAEIAASKYCGVYWTPTISTNKSPRYKTPDLPNGLQVRATRHPEGHLIVRANDSDIETFMLVIVEHELRYRLVGMLVGCAAKIPQYSHHSPGEADCWWVPQSDLDDLPPPGPFGKVVDDVFVPGVNYACLGA
jgi:hypothetical protein